MNSGVDCRCGLDPMLLWLWRRLAAVVPIWPLTWELPYAVGATLKSRSKKKKKKKQRGTHLVLLWSTGTSPRTLLPGCNCKWTSKRTTARQVGAGTPTSYATSRSARWGGREQRYNLRTSGVAGGRCRFIFLMATPMALGSSWTRNWIWAAAATYAAAVAMQDPSTHCTQLGIKLMLLQQFKPLLSDS